MATKDILPLGEERSVRWAPRTLDTLRGFPEAVRWVMGRGLYKAQIGKRHEGAAAMKGRLGGVVEIKTEAESDAYRLYYTLKCPGTVEVLHAHKKKSKKRGRLRPADRDLIHRRYRAAIRRCREREDR